jgi:hypothetical protein
LGAKPNSRKCSKLFSSLGIAVTLGQTYVSAQGEHIGSPLPHRFAPTTSVRPYIGSPLPHRFVPTSVRPYIGSPLPVASTTANPNEPDIYLLKMRYFPFGSFFASLSRAHSSKLTTISAMSTTRGVVIEPVSGDFQLSIPKMKRMPDT